MGSIMIQGTCSGVGKTVLSAALCRILRQEGRQVAPFSPQAIADQSCFTPDGCEIDASVHINALACKKADNVLMNPVLLKSAMNGQYEVMIMGKLFETVSFSEYFRNSETYMDIIINAYNILKSQNEDMIICGAGGTGEPFVQDGDIGNMGFATATKTPVILAADCKRGGVTASVCGTLYMLGKQKKHVHGVILNRFTGDKQTLEIIKQSIPIPVLGVIPDLEKEIKKVDRPRAAINADVLRMPDMTDAFDFAALEAHPDVEVSYISSPTEENDADVIIIPDFESFAAGKRFLRENGFDTYLRKAAMDSKLIIGIGKGYAVMGSGEDELSLIDMNSVQEPELISGYVSAELGDNPSPYFEGLNYVIVNGMERRRLKSVLGPTARPALDGFGGFSIAGNVFGCNIYGLFDNKPFLNGLLSNLRSIKGLTASGAMSEDQHRDIALDSLADIVRENVDMDKIYQIIGDPYTIK